MMLLPNAFVYERALPVRRSQTVCVAMPRKALVVRSIR